MVTTNRLGADFSQWLRYINNILVVWKGEEKQLIELLLLLNNNARNIRLTYVIDLNTISSIYTFVSMVGE